MAFLADTLDRALRLHEAGRLDEAEGLYRQILQLQPRHAEALHLLGMVKQRRGDNAAAVELIGQAIALDRRDARFHSNLAIAYRALGRLDEAAASCRRALRLEPKDAAALVNLGNVQQQQGELAAACDSFRRAVALAPSFLEAQLNLGNALALSGDPEASAEVFRRVLTHLPDHAEAQCGIGNALRDQGDRAAAMACFRRAIACRPDYAEAHFNLGLLELQRGALAAGWREYEWRRGLKRFAPLARFSQPLWRGEPLEGAPILLHAEQGFGDTLQFARYAPLVTARGGRVIVETQPALTRLLRGLADVDAVIERGQPLPETAWQCPLLSLPYAFGTELRNIPAHTPYVAVDNALARRWRTRLSTATGLRVGLVWAGNLANAPLRFRALSLAGLAPLADIPGLAFFSLQKGPAEPPSAGFALTDLAPELEDFTDTAAAILALDLVVSVDTAVAHLAGALGKPVWVLLSHNPDWRWLLGRDDSPWYPTARLFRQSAPGAWEAVVAALAAALRDAAAAHE